MSQPLDEFTFKDRAAGVRQPYCRSCKSEYNRRWYEKNREKQKADVIRRRDERRRIARALVNELKASGACADCDGRFPPEAMDFDHVRGVKSRDISVMVNEGASEEALLEEIAKCELVCSNCHRIRTKRRGYHEPPPRKATRRPDPRPPPAHDPEPRLFE